MDQNTRNLLIAEFLKNTCSFARHVAINYLDAEEWDVENAVISYLGDCKFN
jgi:hypothetical protein